jgi:hypothetical protein
MNRDQRRHPEKKPKIRPDEPMELLKPERPPDERDPRAKSSGHGKKTADKWNQ